jgi:hypothetical protein
VLYVKEADLVTELYVILHNADAGVAIGNQEPVSDQGPSRYRAVTHINPWIHKFHPPW